MTVAPTFAPSPTAPVATVTSTPEPRAIVWWTARADAGWMQAAQQATKQFNDSHPNFVAAVSGGHADFGAVVGAFASGQAPATIEPGDLLPFASRGIVRALDTYVAKGSVKEADYLPQMWASGLWKGKPYGIPALDHGPELGLLWNTSLTAGPGFPPASWNDLLQAGRQLTRANGSGIDVLGFDPLDGVGALLDTARDLIGQDWIDAGSNTVHLNTPGYQGFLSSMLAYYNGVGLDKVNEFRSRLRPMTSGADSGVNQGKQAALLTSFRSVAEVARLAHDRGWRFDSGWGPSTQAGGRVQRIGGRVLTIPQVAKNPDDGWALIEYLTGDDANDTFLRQVGTFAASRSFVASGRWKEQPGLDFWVQSLDQASRLTSRSSNLVAGFAQTKWQQAISDVLTGTHPVPDALKAAQSAIQAELKKLEQ